VLVPAKTGAYGGVRQLVLAALGAVEGRKIGAVAPSSTPLSDYRPINKSLRPHVDL